MANPNNHPDTHCPECHKGNLVVVTRSEEFDFDLGDRTIRVIAEKVPIEVCNECGEELFGSNGVMIRHEAVCRAAGYLTPSEYREIREQLGWSQQHLADFTGFGVATVSRAERGRQLPNLNFDNTLRALRDCPEFCENLQRQLEARKKMEGTVSGRRTDESANQLPVVQTAL